MSTNELNPQKGEHLMTEFHTVDLNNIQLHYAEAPGPGPALEGTLFGPDSRTTCWPRFPARPTWWRPSLSWVGR